jgi:hypothetical protein
MLTFKKAGRPIARIHGGALNNMILYLTDPNAGGPVAKVHDDRHSCPWCGYFSEHTGDVNRHVKVCKTAREEKAARRLAAEKYGQDPDFFISPGGGEIILPPESKLSPLPNPIRRDVLYISGPSGSGKSTYLAGYIREFVTMFPDKEILLFSAIPDDASLRDIEQLKRVNIAELDTNDPFDVKEELSNTLCVFDDIELLDKKMMRYLETIRNLILTQGRSQSGEGDDIYCISTTHLVCDGHSTKKLLNECTALTFFPNVGGRVQIERALTQYGGLSRGQISELMKFAPTTRWMTFEKNNPLYILYERGAVLTRSIRARKEYGTG